MQATPHDIDLEKIKVAVEEIEEIDNIHHVHVWKLNDSQIHFEAHVNLEDNIDMEKMMGVRSRVEHLLHENFSIGHLTLQFGYNCCDGEKRLINV